MKRLAYAAQALAIALALMSAQTPAARAAQDDTLQIGLVGAISMTHWPLLIGLKKGYYADAHLKLELIHTQSSGAVLQQLAAGSIEATVSAALIEPIYAISKGAPIRLVRLEIQLPPYAIEAKPQYKKLEELSGKTIMIDAPTGITKIYAERMLVPHHVAPSTVDYVYAGATGARFNALMSGAIDATILLPPFSFSAEDKGYNNLGLVADYANDLPFTGAAVNTNWASKNPDALRRFLDAHNKSVRWFLDPKNRQESIDIMVEASKLSPEVIGKTYDFLRSRPFFESSGRISKSKMEALLAAVRQLGESKGSTNVADYVLPGIAQLGD
ncbi:MAG TPA: ABC transporter substrate-binding protein [Xanthobacteraceae bacterium]|jgi:ABC-type nitrate/sulfonate/bicarbonate transport system substrate-binding protein|nr:ABC transporter substrate-binding protein [Xanthobacteraceae bacterium]